MKHKDDAAQLEAVFARMRGEDPVPSEALMDRIMLDADTVLSASSPQVTPKAVRPKPSIGARLLDAIGGWPSFGGLAAATVAGVWIGAASPDVLGGVSQAMWGETIELPLFETDILAGWEG